MRSVVGKEKTENEASPDSEYEITHLPRSKLDQFPLSTDLAGADTKGEETVRSGDHWRQLQVRSKAECFCYFLHVTLRIYSGRSKLTFPSFPGWSHAQRHLKGLPNPNTFASRFLKKTVVLFFLLRTIMDRPFASAGYIQSRDLAVKYARREGSRYVEHLCSSTVL